MTGAAARVVAFPRRSLGVDPGSVTGAAVLLDVDGRTALRWWVWTRLKAKGGRYRVTSSDGAAQDVPSLHALASLVARDAAPYDLVLEGLYNARGSGKAAQSIVVLAEATGEVRGPLAAHATQAHRPMASTWRTDILHLPPTMRDDACENHAVMMAPRLFAWPSWPVRGLTYAEEGALAEAACMALWGVRQGEVSR